MGIEKFSSLPCFKSIQRKLMHQLRIHHFLLEIYLATQMAHIGSCGGKTIPGSDHCQTLLPDPVRVKAEGRLVHKNPFRDCLIMVIRFLNRQAG